MVQWSIEWILLGVSMGREVGLYKDGKEVTEICLELFNANGIKGIYISVEIKATLERPSHTNIFH